MTLWLDEQLSPTLAGWITRQLALIARPIRDLGFRNASDPEILFAAREAGAVVLTKDQDFVRVLERHGPPPKVLWITCGNTSNARMRDVLSAALAPALEFLDEGERLAEISDAR